MEIILEQWNAFYDEDVHNVVEQLKHDAADVICLQELTIGNPKQSVIDTPTFIAQSLGYYYYFKEVPIEGTDGSKRMLANGIFSRFPLTNSRFVWINEAERGGYGDEFRAYIEVDLDVNGKPLTVATTHSSYTHAFEDNASKAREISKLKTEIDKHSEDFVFAADLNAVPASDTLATVGSRLQHAGPEFDQPTWTTKPFSYNGFVADTLNYRLDYVFTTPDIVVNSARVVQTEFSDHLPIICTLEI